MTDSHSLKPPAQCCIGAAKKPIPSGRMPNCTWPGHSPIYKGRHKPHHICFPNSTVHGRRSTNSICPSPATANAMSASGKEWWKRLSSRRRHEMMSIVHDLLARREECINVGLPPSSPEDEDRMMEKASNNEPEPMPSPRASPWRRHTLKRS